MEQKTLENKVDSIIKEKIVGRVLSHTCQLFRKGGKYGHMPHGTGVCVHISGRYFIITASHVADDFEEDTNIYVKGDGKFIPITGNLRQTDIDKDKQIDLSYIILDEEIIEPLKFNHDFLTLNKIRGNHKLINATQYMVLGFPERNIKEIENVVSTGASFYLLRPSQTKVYSFHKFNESKIISLDFSGKGINMLSGEKAGKRPDPYGISGCGLWFLDIIRIGEDIEVNYYLIGIVLAGTKNKYQVLWANRIEILIHSMNTFGDINIKSIVLK